MIVFKYLQGNLEGSNAEGYNVQITRDYITPIK